MLELLQRDPAAFVTAAVVLLYSLALHEFAHAWVADRVGDPTARRLGRVTLDPIRHLDPLGSLMLLLVGFGWARPVPIQPQNFRHLRSGLLLVALAGPLTNALLAVASLGALRLLLEVSAAPNEGATRTLALALLLSARINVLLAVFNLLPIPPLDGGKVLQALSPAPLARLLARLERFGFLLVVGLLVVAPGPLYALIDAVAGVLAGWLLP